MEYPFPESQKIPIEKTKLAHAQDPEPVFHTEIRYPDIGKQTSQSVKKIHVPWHHNASVSLPESRDLAYGRKHGKLLKICRISGYYSTASISDSKYRIESKTACIKP